MRSAILLLFCFLICGLLPAQLASNAPQTFAVATRYSIFGQLWEKMNPQRAVLLSPSDRILTDSFDKIAAATAKRPDRLLTSAILESLTPFTTATAGAVKQSSQGSSKMPLPTSRWA